MGTTSHKEYLMAAGDDVKLGKRAKRDDPRTLLLARYTQALPTPPNSIAWSGRVKAWPMYLNDRIGDCTIAAAAHLEQLWSDDTFRPDDAAVLQAYEVVGGYNPSNPGSDQGAVELDVLNYWRRTGIAGSKIEAFAEIKPGDHHNLRVAIDLFGGAYLGLALPLSAQGQTEWRVIPGGAHGRGQPGSWGGHAVPAVDYTRHGVTVITWGGAKHATWAFLAAYLDEAYAVLSPQWLAGGKAPSRFDRAALEADLAVL